MEVTRRWRWLSVEFVVIVLGVLLIVFGIYPSPLIEVIQNAVVAGG